MNQEDAIKFTIEVLKTEEPIVYKSYGYGVYIPKIIRKYVQEHEEMQHGELEMRAIELSPLFLNAAWELCRRGILRPGITKLNTQSTDDGSAGNGYSITPFGEGWLKEDSDDIFVPTEPERFGKLLEPYERKFGKGFKQRSQEAVRCYGAHAYLACSAMCGAAAESILLALSSKKFTETVALKEYCRASGRKALIRKLIANHQDRHTKRQFEALADLLSYWRDESAHGQVSDISDNEAHTSLALLLRLAQFADGKWEDLTRS